MELIKSYNCERYNRGIVIDKISVVDNNQEIGYIKISHMPLAVWRKTYKSSLDYMARFGGWGGCNWDTDISVQDNLSHDVVRNLAWHLWCDNQLHDLIPSMGEEQLYYLFKVMSKQCYDKYRNTIQRFKDAWIDNPFVDYISVEKPFRRQGIGTQLYIEGAKMMAEKGMTLRASTLQSQSAKAAWDKMIEAGLAKKLKDKTIIVV